MRFFKPLPLFWEWLEHRVIHCRLPVVDCGCGDGSLVIEMLERGIPCLGIDPRYLWTDERIPSELCAKIIPGAGETSGIIQDMPSLTLICRPCHNGFTESVKRVIHPHSELYYVGLERNLVADWNDPLEPMNLKPVGEDGELIYRIQ